MDRIVFIVTRKCDPKRLVVTAFTRAEAERAVNKFFGFCDGTKAAPLKDLADRIVGELK